MCGTLSQKKREPKICTFNPLEFPEVLLCCVPVPVCDPEACACVHVLVHVSAHREVK